MTFRDEMERKIEFRHSYHEQKSILPHRNFDTNHTTESHRYYLNNSRCLSYAETEKNPKNSKRMSRKKSNKQDKSGYARAFERHQAYT